MQMSQEKSMLMSSISTSSPCGCAPLALTHLQPLPTAGIGHVSLCCGVTLPCATASYCSPAGRFMYKGST